MSNAEDREYWYRLQAMLGEQSKQLKDATALQKGVTIHEAFERARDINYKSLLEAYFGGQLFSMVNCRCVVPGTHQTEHYKVVGTWHKPTSSTISDILSNVVYGELRTTSTEVQVVVDAKVLGRLMWVDSADIDSYTFTGMLTNSHVEANLKRRLSTLIASLTSYIADAEL